MLCSFFSDVRSREHASSADSSEASSDQTSMDEGDVGQYFCRNETHLMLFDSVQSDLIVQKISDGSLKRVRVPCEMLNHPLFCSPAT